MKRDYTEEEIKEFIAKLVREGKERKIREYENARLEMEEAERALYLVLNGKQRAAYDEYRKKRDVFYEKANEIYVNMFDD